MKAPLDFTDAGWANGAALLAWLGSLGIRIVPLTESWQKKLERWRGGARANFYDVDEVLVRVGLHVSQVPVEIWCAYNNGRQGCGGHQKAPFVTSLHQARAA